MPFISKIKFYSNSAINVKYQQNPQAKMSLNPISDSIHFTSRQISPKNVYNYFGVDFVRNKLMPNSHVSTKIYPLEQAKEIVKNMQNKVDEVYNNLATYQPEQFNEWIGAVLKNSQKETVQISTCTNQSPVPHQFGENEAFLGQLIKEQKENIDKKMTFITIHDHGSSPTTGEFLWCGDKRIGEKMNDYILEKFVAKGEQATFKNNGLEYLIKPEYSEVNGFYNGLAIKFINH